MTRFLIIIPAFNEEAALPRVLRSLEAHTSPSNILVVDDGSSDRTADVARSAGVAVASLPFNLGIGGALRTGFSYAIQQGYERAVQFDADGQHDVSSIGRLLESLDRGADMVIGSRFADSSTRYQVGSTRRRAMQFVQLAVKVLSGRAYTDVTSGFRAFSKPVLSFFASSYPAEYMESTESLLMALDAGFRVEEVPVVMHIRAGGQSSARNLRLPYHYVRLLLVMITSMTRRTRRPKDGTS